MPSTFGRRQETAIHQLFRQNEALLTDSLQ